MPHFLKKSGFAQADLAKPEVQAFHCGDERWEVEVAEWIKSRVAGNSALQDILNFGTEVWLHWNEQDELVGISSLGESTWKWPPPHGAKTQISIIPCVGVAKEFQGEPKGSPPEDRYASQILDHLIYEATTKINRHPVIGLMVDEANKRAIRFYEKAGFIQLVQPHKSGGVLYRRMALDISAHIQ